MKAQIASTKSSTFKLATTVTTSIHAPVTKIMALLTTAEEYTLWNSTVLSVRGAIKKGETIQLVSTLDPKRKFNLKVVERTNTLLIWEDGMAPFFRGVRSFTLTERKDGMVNFEMTEVFDGVMLPMIKGSLPDFRASFDQFAADLKKAAEKDE